MFGVYTVQVHCVTVLLISSNDVKIFATSPLKVCLSEIFGGGQATVLVTNVSQIKQVLNKFWKRSMMPSKRS